ncbi:hypothetical protein EDB86DRAFT_3075702 [Lactarius hatsudake]|nr:hypothetical protein EDB86DRAFT_3075702 [Lactarius hatsudake]
MRTDIGTVVEKHLCDLKSPFGARNIRVNRENSWSSATASVCGTWCNGRERDRPEEIITPGAAVTTAQATAARPTVLRETFQPPPDKVIHLTTDSKGKPTPAASMPPSWANITRTGMSQQQKGTAQAKAVTEGTFRSNAGKARPETVQRCAQSGNTEATVIRFHGVDDHAIETTIRAMTPASIIASTRTEVDRLTGGRVTLLSGRWSSNKNKRIHNFVYTFKGQLTFRDIYPLRDVLVKPLLAGHLVPNDGWTFAQIRDTTTSDATGSVYTGSQLEEELRRNPAFEDTIFCIAPHWQGSLNKVSHNPRGTVKFAYVDENGQTTARAKRDGVFLFNERTRFVPTGDVATIKLCGRCHRIGHSTDSPACPLPEHAVRCFICGGAHHSDDHATNCPRPHDKVGECRCLFPCINCGGNHNARSPHCKQKMGFAPPILAPRPSSDTVTPAPSAKGKAPQRPPAASPPSDEILVSTQRDAAPDQEELPFELVTRKTGKKAKKTARIQAEKAAINASVPGSASFTTNPSQPAPAPSTAPPTQSGSGSVKGSGKGKGKLTSIVPARPAYKSQPPKPPTWREAPIITKRHVATDLECATAMEHLFGHAPSADDLRSLHVAWGGHPSDEEATALWTLHFKWAVKYGLPLTISQTIDVIVGTSGDGAVARLLRFEEDWGTANPRNYLLSTIPRDQYFAQPGDLEETVISPEDAKHNRDMARHLVHACIRFKVLEAKANNTPPPPAITEPVIEAVLDLYSHNGTYSFFSIAKASTEDNDIWTAISDVHSSATSALAAYA